MYHGLCQQKHTACENDQEMKQEICSLDQTYYKDILNSVLSIPLQESNSADFAETDFIL